MSKENIKNALSAYPLCWPVGWKRTDPEDRTRGRFNKSETVSSKYNPGLSYTNKKSLSISDANKRVLKSLEAITGSSNDILVSSNIPVRKDGLPRSVYSKPDDPGVAVYWGVSTTDCKVMAVDRYDRVADNIAAIAATLDSMRTIERHGGAVILERAFTGFAALPTPENAGGWRWQDILQVGANYTLAECELNYKKLRSAAHREGNTELYMQLNRAIDQARNELKGK